jgi:NADH dehydrogenase [ubiquinone] 1 alpha subcomplex assembly factor 1
VVEPQREMLTQKVRTIGIGLIDRQPGPYDLSISRMWATNAYNEDDVLREALRTSRGGIEGMRKEEAKRLPQKEEPEKILI